MHNGDDNSKRSHDWQHILYSVQSECNEASVESLPIPRTAHKHIAFISLVSVRLKLGAPSIRIGANKNQFRLRGVLRMWIWHQYFHASFFLFENDQKWHVHDSTHPQQRVGMMSMVAAIWFVFNSKFSEPQSNRTRFREFYGDHFIRRVTYVVKCINLTQNSTATSERQKQTKTLHVK